MIGSGPAKTLWDRMLAWIATVFNCLHESNNDTYIQTLETQFKKQENRDDQKIRVKHEKTRDKSWQKRQTSQNNSVHQDPCLTLIQAAMHVFKLELRWNVVGLIERFGGKTRFHRVLALSKKRLASCWPKKPAMWPV
jgi:hypothetical protein